MNAYVLWRPSQDLASPNYRSPLAAYTTLEEAAKNAGPRDGSTEITEVTVDPPLPENQDRLLPEDLMKAQVENDHAVLETPSGVSGFTRIKKAYVVWSPGMFPFAFRNSSPLAAFTSSGHAWEWREWFLRKMGEDSVFELQISEVSLDPDPISPI